MRRASLLLVCTLACEPGSTRYLDLAQLEDGPKVLVELAPDEARILDAVLFQVTDGRADIPLGRPLEARANRTWLVEVPAEVRTSDRGPVVELELSTMPGTPTALEGSRLIEHLRAEQARTFDIAPDRPLTEVPLSEAKPLLERLDFRRAVETEPCPPAFGPLGPPIRLLDFDLGWQDPGLVTLDVPKPGVVVMGFGAGIIASVGGAVVGAKDLGSRAMSASDLGYDLSALLPLGDGRYATAGGHGPVSISVVELADDGWTLIGTTTVSAPRFHSLTQTNDGIYAFTRYGGIYAAPDPLGPWARIVDDAGTRPTYAQIGSDERRVAYGYAGEIQVLNDPRWASRRVMPPVGRSNSVEVLEWFPGNQLWVGFDEGDVGILEEIGPPTWLEGRPARMHACSQIPNPTDEHLQMEIRDIRTDGAFAYILVNFCRAVWTLSLPDHCSGLVAPLDEDLPTDMYLARLALTEQALYVGAQGGYLMTAPRLRP